jgi:hypothetical protein
MKHTLPAVLLLAGAGIALGSGPALAIGNIADIRIFDRNENRQLTVYWHDGKAYVVGKPGNEYQISVRNRAGADALAVVSVDGVNVVSGESAAPEQTGYVLGNGVNYDIRGWRKSLSRTAAFYFTTLPDSYAARTGRPDNVGVIGVAVYRSKAVPPPVAIDSIRERYESRSAESMRDNTASGAAQLSRRADGPAADPRVPSPAPATPELSLQKSLGTGHGRSETSVVRNVAFERATPYPEEVITLYYDSFNNLLARGIVPAEPVARPQPQPFPGRFVADPPRG